MYNKVLLSMFFILGLGATLVVLVVAIGRRQEYRQHAASSLTPDKVVSQILVDQNTNGWDPKYNGILINWRRDALDKVNCSSNACDTRGSSTRHDGQNDVRNLENLYWYKYRHPGDTSMDTYISREAPFVKNSWGNTNLNKGWVYFMLLRIAKYSGDSSWYTTADHWAASQITKIDPKIGVEHGTITVSTANNAPTLHDAYRVDQELELGAALVDAGKRFNNSTYTAAGLRAVQVITQQAFVPAYHLFSRIYVISDPTYGSNKIYDYQAKLGEQGEEIEALLSAGIYTNNSGFLTTAQQMLDALATLPVHDTTYGGFFSKIYIGPYDGHKAGDVDTKSKEGGRQLRMLESFHLGNMAFGNKWVAMEQELLMLSTTPGKAFTSGTSPGFSYEQLPNWQQYPCSSCTPNPTENWNSAEANNIAMEGLQTVLSDTVSTTLTPTSHVSPTPTPNPSVTSQITPTKSPTPTIPSGNTTINIIVCPHGIAGCGDNANPASQGTATPVHDSRVVTLTLMDSSNHPAATLQGTVMYNDTTKNFQGTLLSLNLPSGQYLGTITMDGYLHKQVPGIITITKGQSVTLPLVSLIAGDITNDNQLTILDYNMIIGCFGSKQNTSSCTVPPTNISYGADITDDGFVDGSDYNLFLRELSVQKGDQ